MASVGKVGHELQIVDRDVTWRIMYYVDQEAVVILEVFAKKTRATPRKVVDVCKGRLRDYRDARA